MTAQLVAGVLATFVVAFSLNVLTRLVFWDRAIIAISTGWFVLTFIAAVTP